MREIKFKGWDKIDKKMRIVTRITFGLESTGHPPIIIHLDDGKDSVTRSINDVDLLQYTGWKDKEGEEIYEENIVKGKRGIVKHVGVVKYSNKYVDYRVFTYPEHCYFSLNEFSPIEIVGNKQENPELLVKEE